MLIFKRFMFVTMVVNVLALFVVGGVYLYQKHQHSAQVAESKISARKQEESTRNRINNLADAINRNKILLLSQKDYDKRYLGKSAIEISNDRKIDRSILSMIIDDFDREKADPNFKLEIISDYTKKELLDCLKDLDGLGIYFIKSFVGDDCRKKLEKVFTTSILNTRVTFTHHHSLNYNTNRDLEYIGEILFMLFLIQIVIRYFIMFVFIWIFTGQWTK